MIKPTTNRVIIKAKPVETKTASGLVVMGKTDNTLPEGTVVAVGPGLTLENGVHLPMVVSVGDTVVYIKDAGTKTKVDGQEYLIMTEDSILGILSED